MPGPASNRVVFEMMDSAQGRGVFPGGVLAVSLSGELVHESAHGLTSTWPPGERVTASTVFDLASLTKALSTTALVVKLVERGQLELDSAVSKTIPAFSGEGRESVTISQLLKHTSGLAAWRPFFEEVAAARGGALLATRKGLEAVRKMVVAERPLRTPGKEVEYSDLGFILLDWIVERTCGRSIDREFYDTLAVPLGLKDTFFVDLKDHRKARDVTVGRSFAATERCTWRGRVLVGEVHDDNAYAMGGVSGHAGLFSTATDVLRMAGAWLDSWQGRASLFERGLVERFWERRDARRDTRVLGFDVPAAVDSQAGSRFGPASVGHTGFTGTSLWMDPERSLVVVLLTNRVHPTRENDAIRQFRPGLHDKIVEVFTE